MTTPGLLATPDTVRIVSWNINRGQRLNEVIEFLSATAADLILLQEADWNARRTHCRNVAREIAQALAMNYVFGCEFEELTQRQQREACLSWAGDALSVSPFKLAHPQVLSSVEFLASAMVHPAHKTLPEKDWRKNGTHQAASISLDRNLMVYNVHLESRGNDGLRCSQLAEILGDVSQHASDTQIVIAGDFNADLRREPAASAIGKIRAQQSIRSHLESSHHCAVSFQWFPHHRLDPDEGTAHCF